VEIAARNRNYQI